MTAYNTGGGKVYYAKDLARHGGSSYKGFIIEKGNKVLK